MRKPTLNTRFISLFNNRLLDKTFTTNDLRIQWKSSWHKSNGKYRKNREFDKLFYYSFMRNVVRPLLNNGILVRIEKGHYRVLNTSWLKN